MNDNDDGDGGSSANMICCDLWTILNSCVCVFYIKLCKFYTCLYLWVCVWCMVCNSNVFPRTYRKNVLSYYWCPTVFGHICCDRSGTNFYTFPYIWKLFMVSISFWLLSLSLSHCVNVMNSKCKRKNWEQFNLRMIFALGGWTEI